MTIAEPNLDHANTQTLAAAWDARVATALSSAPGWLRERVEWLRHPNRRALRVVAGVLLILGGVLSILPVLGLWMLPLGLALLAEDRPSLKALLERSAVWLAHAWRKTRAALQKRRAARTSGS